MIGYTSLVYGSWLHWLAVGGCVLQMEEQRKEKLNRRDNWITEVQYPPTPLWMSQRTSGGVWVSKRTSVVWYMYSLLCLVYMHRLVHRQVCAQWCICTCTCTCLVSALGIGGTVIHLWYTGQHSLHCSLLSCSVQDILCCCMLHIEATELHVCTVHTLNLYLTLRFYCIHVH